LKPGGGAGQPCGFAPHYSSIEESDRRRSNGRRSEHEGPSENEEHLKPPYGRRVIRVKRRIVKRVRRSCAILREGSSSPGSFERPLPIFTF
jgi:hypothetical protein